MTEHSRIASRALTFLALAAAIGLTACNSTQPQASVAAAVPPRTESYASAPVTPQGFRLPEGSGCQGKIARWAAIQDNDYKTGNVGKTVFAQIQGEIAEARAACAAGNSAQAIALVRASRARHGYPG